MLTNMARTFYKNVNFNFKATDELIVLINLYITIVIIIIIIIFFAGKDTKYEIWGKNLKVKYSAKLGTQ